jgi:hypothetical protein
MLPLTVLTGRWSSFLLLLGAEGFLAGVGIAVLSISPCNFLAEDVGRRISRKGSPTQYIGCTGRSRRSRPLLGQQATQRHLDPEIAASGFSSPASTPGRVKRRHPHQSL